MTILKAKKESFIKANVEMKSKLEAKQDAVIVKWRDVLNKKTTKENVE